MNAIHSLVEALTLQINNCKAALLTPCTTEHDFLIGRGGLYIASLERDENFRPTGAHTVTGDPTEAMRFSQNDAKNIADLIQDTGEHFTVHSLIDACQKTLSDAKKSYQNASVYLLAA